jgi:hypothetical protein
VWTGFRKDESVFEWRIKVKQVLVDWVDSHSTNGWCCISDDTQIHFPCTTIGYLICDTKECIKLAMTITDNPDYVHTIISIPKCSVTKVKEIR